MDGGWRDVARLLARIIFHTSPVCMHASMRLFKRFRVKVHPRGDVERSLQMKRAGNGKFRCAVAWHWMNVSSQCKNLRKTYSQDVRDLIKSFKYDERITCDKLKCSVGEGMSSFKRLLTIAAGISWLEMQLYLFWIQAFGLRNVIIRWSRRGWFGFVLLFINEWESVEIIYNRERSKIDLGTF